MPAVEQAAEAAGGWGSVEGIAVGLGPGSFTGLRIGIATAKALAGSLGIPAHGVCTLDALGRGAAGGAAARACLAAIDARRGEVFAALYGPGGPGLGPVRLDPLRPGRAPLRAGGDTSGGRLGGATI